jgi:hypothetical protein
MVAWYSGLTLTEMDGVTAIPSPPALVTRDDRERSVFVTI